MPRKMSKDIEYLVLSRKKKKQCPKPKQSSPWPKFSRLSEAELTILPSEIVMKLWLVCDQKLNSLSVILHYTV